MKIKSFKGRRLICELTTEQVAAQTGIDEATIKKIEAIEDEIKKLNTFYENQKEEGN